MCNEEILRQMEEDMTFRGLSEKTKESYIWRVTKYMEYHKGKDIETLTEDDIRDFLRYLVEKGDCARRAINTYNSAIRYVYGTTLNKVLNLKRIPLFKIQKNKPEMFTKDELKRFFEACSEERHSLKYKAMFMTVYGGGLRVSELINLRIQDIDSKSMRILIREGKEKKYRYTLLSQTNLEVLREYFKVYRPTHKENYLFISPQTKDKYTLSGPEIIFRHIKKKAGITRKVTIHRFTPQFCYRFVRSRIRYIAFTEVTWSFWNKSNDGIFAFG